MVVALRPRLTPLAATPLQAHRKLQVVHPHTEAVSLSGHLAMQVPMQIQIHVLMVDGMAVRAVQTVGQTVAVAVDGMAAPHPGQPVAVVRGTF